VRSRRLSSLPALAVVVLLVAACGGGSSTTGSSTTAAGPGPTASQSPPESSPRQSGPLPGHPKIDSKPGHGSGGARRPGESSPRRSRSQTQQQGSASKAAPAHAQAAERTARRPARAARRRLARAAAPFLVAQGDNSIPTYGTEAPGSQLAAAEAALSGYLSARAEGNWAAACSLISASVAKQLEALAGEAGGTKPNCAAVYAKLSERAPAAERADPLTQGLTALRVESPHAFALFVGPGSQQYMMPMEEEGGGWKVTQIAPVPWPLGSSDN
jgi:hypothetical protein